MQLMHEVAPLESWNMPGKHESHAALPAPEILPTSQLVHAVDLLALAYLPASQPVHKFASAAECLPAAQLGQTVPPLDAT